ncbi:MAG: haloacid dehalogenase type II [Deltaproteobacteria bacterium]|nr:MAG: haloacid dehalogenase type II [Deltaproteobacteria bacterium]
MRLELVAFDLYGTLLDVSGLAKRLEPYAGPQAADLLSSWRKAQLERTWREKAYEPFDMVTARALEEVAPRLGAQDRLRMCETWLSLPPFPDARAALESLRRARIRRAVLSNGTPAMIRAALAAADLEVDDLFSADDVRAYKPDPKVYALLRREGTLFVSANGWDAEGAKRSGLTVAWIDRGTPPPGLAPDLRVHSLGELAAAVWREQGVRVVKGTELDPNTAQTPGMTRAAAITHARAGAEKIWAGTVIIHPNAKTGAHHHGPVESVLYVVRGRARMRWGERLEYTAEAGPGDFIYVPPYVPHQEINASREQPLECVVIRSGQEPVVVNLDIAPVEPPEEVKWIDPIHRS